MNNIEKVQNIQAKIYYLQYLRERIDELRIIESVKDASLLTKLKTWFNLTGSRRAIESNIIWSITNNIDTITSMLDAYINNLYEQQKNI